MAKKPKSDAPQAQPDDAAAQTSAESCNTSGGRNGKRDLLALSIAGGMSVREAAAHHGMAERTGYEYWADLEFRALVTSMRADMVASAAGRLSQNMTATADKLFKLTDDANSAVALGACKSLLALGFQAFEQLNLAERMAAIEAKMKEKACPE